VKLSLKKKLGWVHVRGGELVRVVQAHAVQTNTSNINQTEHNRPADDTKWVYCEAGDLALEIINVKTGVMIAHSYLSGPAIQLARYTPPQVGWFGPATLLGTATLPEPTEQDHGDAFIERFVGAMMGLKYGGIDIVAYRGRAHDLEHAHGQMDAMIRAWKYVPAADVPDKPVCTTHLIGIIEQCKKKGGTLVHFQPPHHASDIPASIFQAGLVLSAAEYASRKEEQ
jgi:hypothetical protein